MDGFHVRHIEEDMVRVRSFEGLPIHVQVVGSRLAHEIELHSIPGGLHTHAAMSSAAVLDTINSIKLLNVVNNTELSLCTW